MKFKGLTNSILGTILTLAGCNNYRGIDNKDIIMSELEINSASDIKNLEKNLIYGRNNYGLRKIS